jgi:hypothetical protein
LRRCQKRAGDGVPLVPVPSVLDPPELDPLVPDPPVLPCEVPADGVGGGAGRFAGELPVSVRPAPDQPAVLRAQLLAPPEALDPAELDPAEPVVPVVLVGLAEPVVLVELADVVLAEPPPGREPVPGLEPPLAPLC